MTIDLCYTADIAKAEPVSPRPLRVQTTLAYDADEQARSLHGWSQVYDQLTAGRFVGKLTGLHMEDMHVFCESTSQTLRQTCEVQSDAYWFGIPARNSDTARIDANVLGDDAIALRPGGVEFELFTPAGFDIYGVVVKGELLRRHAASVEHCELVEPLSQADVISIEPEDKARLCASIEQILQSDGVATVATATHARLNLQASVVASLFDLCTSATAEPVAVPLRPRRQWVVSEARDYVLANRDRPVGVPELCERLHVSRRTLQYCFQDVLGIAPAAYLRAIRLNGARRDLCDVARGVRSVQEIAVAWGFWHLSQFATDYRKLFGVRPSETLKAASGVHAATQRSIVH
jgi:AraC family ethanolamine operon transcriptional activator